MHTVHRHRTLIGLLMAFTGLALSGCGSHYVVFHPAGPVAQRELNLIVESTVVVSVIIVLVWVLFAIVLIRFRDTPDNHAPYWPDWTHHRALEVLVFVLPAAVLVIIAIPTVRGTYALDAIPTRHPLVIDVTSLDYKWLFEYPRQQIATVNYFNIPTHQPVLFELTSRAPLGAFWAPNLGGMEYTMPNRVLPLWLEATRPGTFLGRNANFTGIDFWRMTFHVHAENRPSFSRWVHHVKASAPPMTMTTWRQLLHYRVTPRASYSSYPAQTFPEQRDHFTVKGLHYAPSH